MKKLDRVTALVLIIAGVFGLSGCGGGAAAAQEASPSVPQLSPPPGSPCTVEFRREALGLAGRLAVSHRTGVVGDSDLTLRGLFQAMDSAWVVLSSLNEDGTMIWIPRETILTLEVGRPKRP